MKRFLVVNPFGLGDAIFSMTLVEAIRAECPEAFIGFVGNERTKDLIRMDASIDRTYVFNRDLFRRLKRKSPLLFLKKLRGFLDLIRQERYDAVFDLSLGREYSFFAAWLGIPGRFGLDYKGRGIFLTKKLKLEGYAGRHVVETQLDLLPLAGLKRPPVSGRLPLRVPDAAKKEAADFFRDAGLSAADPVVAVAPGGGRSWGNDAIYKQWPPERFAEAVNLFTQKRRAGVLLVGDRAEKPLLDRTASLVRAPHAVASGQPLDFVAACLQRSSILFCNDGGLMHLANALGVKTVAVFGPVDERAYGAYGTAAPHRTLVATAPCRPCYANFHFPVCGNDRRCLTEIAPESAASAAEEIA